MPVEYCLFTEGTDGNRQAVWSSQAALKIPTGRIDLQMLRYLLAICIGAAAILAWQSYGAAIRQVIATRAPELGWSPETKQMIASAIQEVGWTTPANPEPPAPETVASKAPSATSLDPAQVQQMVQSLATLRQTVEQMAAGQDELKRDIVQMHSVLIDVLVKMPEPLRQPPAAAERKSSRRRRRHRGPRQRRHGHQYHLSSKRPHSRAVMPLGAGRTRRSQNSCAYRGRASPTKCTRSIVGEC